MLSEKIELRIGDKKFAHWSDLDISICVDKFDTIEFSAPFEPSRKEFRKLFRPFSFAPVELLLNGSPLFNGTLLDVDPTSDPDGKTVKVSCYAKPAVLADCTAPTGEGYKGRRPKGAIQLQFTNLSLLQIAQQLCDPFDIDCEFRGDPGAPFDKVAIKIEENIFPFLVGLAKQRGFVITNTEDGKLLFWKTIARGVPVVQFAEGTPPFTGIKPSFSPREYFSQITGYAPAKRNKKGSVYTAPNKWLGEDLESGGPINTFRPHSCKFDDTERADAPEATKAKLGRMFANMASYVIEDLPTWRDPDGKLWQPNTSLSVLSPGAMIYKPTELLIREVRLRQNADELSARLDLVLPGAFSGKIPESLPWLD